MNVRKTIIALMIVAGAIYTFSNRAVEVTEVIDGDSIVVGSEQVRLAHIDAPEWNQPFGRQAKEFVMGNCLGWKVRLKRMGKDQYGRTLAEVILPDGRNLNQELVREGLAWHYRRYSHDRFYQELEHEARAKKKGLWADSYTIAPWEWRRKSQ